MRVTILEWTRLVLLRGIAALFARGTGSRLPRSHQELRRGACSSVDDGHQRGQAPVSGLLPPAHQAGDRLRKVDLCHAEWATMAASP
jgi:hypothetical protein